MKIAAYMLSGAVLLSSFGCRRSDHQDIKAQGDKLLVQIQQHSEGSSGVADRLGLVSAGIDLGEWRYVKIDDRTFMLSKSIGIKKHLKYRSDIPGKFGNGWSIVDDNGNEEWIP